MKRNWMTGLLIVMVLMAITACSTGSKNNEAENSESNDAAKQRIVKSEKGEISIPDEPERVIGLSVVYPEFLYALGTIPIAVQNYHNEFPSYLAEPFKNTLKMGIAKTPDFEAILDAEPDLIIAPDWWSEKDYDQLSEIAPTVLLPLREDWRDELRDIGEVLGKQEQAEQVIADLKAKVAETSTKLDELVGDETVMYIRIMADEVVLHGKTSDRGKFIYDQLGLQPIAKFPSNEDNFSISLEVMPEYNPDHLIVQLDDDTNDDVNQRYEDMTSSALWKNLKAVKADQVYLVGGKEWFNLGMSPVADSYAIDAILDAFAKKQK